MKRVIKSNFKTCHNLYSCHDLYSGKPIFTQALMIWLVEVSQKTVRSSKKKYAMWVNFRFWPMKNILQIYRELLFLVTFFQFHSNLWEVSCLSWQKLNLKITCHIKLKFFWTPRKLTPCKMSHIFWDTSTSSQVSNCDSVALEIYLDHKFQWPQESFNCESLAYEVVI